MKRIVTNILIATDLSDSTIKHKLVFDKIRIADIDTEAEEITYLYKVSKITTEASEGVEEVKELIKTFKNTKTKAEVNALYPTLTIDATDYFDRTQEEFLKGIIEIINAAGSYGLTRDDLVIE